MAALRFAPVTDDTWPDFEALFESPGAPKYCWCMAWRDMPDRQAASNADRKQAIRSMVKAGTPVGIMAYAGDEPVAWCSVAPRDSLRRLHPEHRPDPGTWAITCFFVRREHRGKGLAAALLDAAVAHAFQEGAAAVEATPVDPDSPSYRFMGFRSSFARRGFRETGMGGSRRHVMRLER